MAYPHVKYEIHQGSPLQVFCSLGYIVFVKTCPSLLFGLYTDLVNLKCTMTYVVCVVGAAEALSLCLEIGNGFFKVFC